jgi:hypothetical protein
VGYHRSILEQAGIPCFVRNEHAAALSELQDPAFYLILCVVDEYYDEAIAVLLPYYELQRQKELHASLKQDWLSPRCGESVPASFDFCWDCQRERPGSEGVIQS